jgi:FkbM family methyltransferase
MAHVPARLERLGFRTLYRLADLTYTVGLATPKRTVAGTYWSYEPTNPHGDDPGLAALDALPTDATLLDAGAHVGEHAIPLAVDTDRRVVAIEPNGESADRLARNAARNGLADRIDLRRLGVGDERTTLPFYRSTFSKCSAFDRDSATRWGARVAGVETVPVYRIDDLVGATPDAPDVARVPPPDAVKIDVEGHELAVLRGAERTLREHRPLLVLEVHDESRDPDGRTSRVGAPPDAADPARTLRSWLSERGYDVDDRGDVWVCRG